MGRNAEKRRARREARVKEEHEERTQRHVEAAVQRGAPAHDVPPPWWAESLLRADAVDEGPDPTLSAALFRVSALLVSRDLTKGLEHVELGAVAVELGQLLGVDTLTLYRWREGDDENGALVKLASSARLTSDEVLLALAADDPLVRAVVDEERPVRVDDAARDARLTGAHGQRSHVGSLLLAPMISGDELFGVLVASRKEVRGFYDADEQRVELVAASLAQDLVQARRLREALVDPETGLMSRMALLEALPREVERARRYGTPLSVLMLHLDGVRDIAERFGIVVTRELMAEVGRRLPTRVRRADLTVRFGADVFLVLSPVGAEDAARGCQRLIDAVSQEPFRAGDVDIPLVVSASAATLEDEDDDALALLLRAEASLPLQVVKKPTRPEGAVDPVDRRT